MKKIIIGFFLTLFALNLHAQKTAVLVAQFGTSNTEGRTAALDVIFQDIKTAFPGVEVREAYTSPTICRILEKKGIHKDSAVDALLRLHLEGYDKVFVQPTFLLDGIEMNMLREDVEKVASFFKDVKVGEPLLSEISDFQQVVSLLQDRVPGKNEAVMYVGHGNQKASTAAYTMLGNMLKAAGIPRCYFGTVEGWPDLEQSVKQLEGQKIRKVTLVPFLLAAGVHTHEDIDGEWKPALEQAGYQVEVYFHGLGENPAFRQLIISHLKQIMK